MNDDEQNWYDSLTEANHEQMRNKYVDEVIGNPLLANQISYEQFVLSCAKIAVKFGNDEKKLDSTLMKVRSASERLKRKQRIKVVRSLKGKVSKAEYKRLLKEAHDGPSNDEIPPEEYNNPEAMDGGPSDAELVAMAAEDKARQQHEHEDDGGPHD